MAPVPVRQLTDADNLRLARFADEMSRMLRRFGGDSNRITENCAWPDCAVCEASKLQHRYREFVRSIIGDRG